MEKENLTFKKNFVNLFCEVTKMCKEANREINKNYQKGRKEGFEEILIWFNNAYNNGKYISVNSFCQFLQEKIDKTKNKCDNEVKPIFDLNEIKLKKDYEIEEGVGFNDYTSSSWGNFKPEIFLPNKKAAK